jgi:hypothetical protein
LIPHLIKILIFLRRYHHLNHGTVPSSSQNEHRHEADINKKTRFYHAINNRAANAIIKDDCEAEEISHGTGKR